VLINDVDNADYNTWKVNSTDLGNYITASDKMYEVGQTASVYAVRTFADGTSDIGFQQAAYDYSSIIL